MGLLKNLITFGASSRVENKIEEFNNLKEEYENLFERMEQRRTDVNEVLQEVIEVKVNCVKSLKQITKLSNSLQSKDREQLYRAIGADIEMVGFDAINNTISTAEIAMNMTKGVSAGVSTALGTWALVSSIGTASTGTAIAGLSGAAATNATLAWLGGGVLAAGGGGMAAGTVVLGGIVAIPALILTGVFSHLKANRQIAEIENKMQEIIKSIDLIKSNILKLDLLENRSEELIVSLKKFKEVFDLEFNKMYKQIYPSLFSKFWKEIRKKFLRQNYFSDEDLKNIAYIGGLATDFAMLIDTKPIEDSF